MLFRSRWYRMCIEPNRSVCVCVCVCVCMCVYVCVCVSLPGSPKRKQFQRQRAASDTTEQTGEDSSPLGEDSSPFGEDSSPLGETQPLPCPPDWVQLLSARSLSPPTTPPSPSISSRYHTHTHKCTVDHYIHRNAHLFSLSLSDTHTHGTIH